MPRSAPATELREPARPVRAEVEADLPAADLDPGTVKRELHSIVAAGKLAMARLTTAYGGPSWLGDRSGPLETDPFRGAPVDGVPSRERVLTDAELRPPEGRRWPGLRQLNCAPPHLDRPARRGSRGHDMERVDRRLFSVDHRRTGRRTAPHTSGHCWQAQAILPATRRDEGPDQVFPAVADPSTALARQGGLGPGQRRKDRRLHDLRRNMATAFNGSAYGWK